MGVNNHGNESNWKVSVPDNMTSQNYLKFSIIYLSMGTIQHWDLACSVLYSGIIFNGNN